MQLILYIGIGVILLLLVWLIWRLSSNRRSISCPSWLAWMVEIDNPLLKNNSTKAILSHLDLQPGMHVLDFGCGPGRLTIPMARQLSPSGKVTAFDIQPAMLESTRLKALQENLNNIDFVQGAAGEGKLGSNQYDRAILVTVLGEVPNRQALMKEIFDSLKPGGWLSFTEVIADPHFQKRSSVSRAASEAGFQEKSVFGNHIDYTILFEKP